MEAWDRRTTNAKIRRKRGRRIPEERNSAAPLVSQDTYGSGAAVSERARPRSEAAPLQLGPKLKAAAPLRHCPLLPAAKP
eukprot:scaffold596_cov236-Pinguiococcus_pyrenoidosus.AAC.13